MKDYARELYRTWRTNSRKSRTTTKDEVRERVEDPQQLSNILNELVAHRDWRQGIAEGTLFTDWAQVVGAEIASHATPVSLVDGLLTVQTTSTAWATQMRMISTQLLTTISQSAPGALVEELVIIGPHTPSWKKGIRNIKNARGPRDTYG